MSNTPKPDLTVDQIENFRSYCHAYLEKIGPTHGLVDCVCDLALKGIEAFGPNICPNCQTIFTDELCSEPSTTPRKPKPSGEREDIFIEGYFTDLINAGVRPSIKEPSPTPGDKDVDPFDPDLAGHVLGLMARSKQTPSGSVEHELKVWPASFAEVEAGRKLFEVRYNDRGYKVGDRLRLREYEPGPDTYTGREVRETIAYIIKDTDVPFGAAALKPGYCVLGLSGISKVAKPSDSVEGLVEQVLADYDSIEGAPCRCAEPETYCPYCSAMTKIREGIKRLAESLSRMEQERDAWMEQARGLSRIVGQQDEVYDEVSEQAATVRRLSLEVGRLRSAAQWAIPLAEIALENHRTGRIKADHADIRGKHADGRLVIGLWQDEIDEWDKARNALTGGAEK